MTGWWDQHSKPRPPARRRRRPLDELLRLRAEAEQLRETILRAQTELLMYSEEMAGIGDQLARAEAAEQREVMQSQAQGALELFTAWLGETQQRIPKLLSRRFDDHDMYQNKPLAERASVIQAEKYFDKMFAEEIHDMLAMELFETEDELAALQVEEMEDEDVDSEIATDDDTESLGEDPGALGDDNAAGDADGDNGANDGTSDGSNDGSSGGSGAGEGSGSGDGGSGGGGDGQ